MATRLISFLIIVWKVIMYYINTNIICGKQHCVLFPTMKPIDWFCVVATIWKCKKQAILGQNIPYLSHLPENIHKRFCAHPAEKQDALFCCSVNFHHWRYGFESLSPVLTDKTAAISEGKFRRGRHILPRRLLFVKKMFIMHDYTESYLDKLMNFHWKLKKYQLWYRLRCRIKVRKWIFTWIKAIV